jgi:ribosomal protein S17
MYYKEYEIDGSKMKLGNNAIDLKINNGKFIQKLNGWVYKDKQVLETLIGNLIQTDSVVKPCNYDVNNFSFSIKDKYGSEVIISLRYGDWMDSFPEIIIKENINSQLSMSRKYECDCHKGDDDSDKQIYIKLETISYDNGKVQIYKYLTEYFTSLHVRQGNHHYNLWVNNLEDHDSKTFEVPYEEQLKDMFLNLTYPIAIDELFKKITAIIGNVNIYPKFELTKETEVSENKEVKTDEIILKDGELVSFMTTRPIANGKEVIIAMDENGHFSFNLDNLYNLQTDLHTAINDASSLIEEQVQFVKKIKDSK